MLRKQGGNMGAMRGVHEKHNSQIGLAQFEDQHAADGRIKSAHDVSTSFAASRR
jgi:hypothetical protein